MINGVWVVGLGGKARSGKDTFADFMACAIRSTPGEYSCIRSLASPIKTMAASFISNFMPFSELSEHMYGDKKEEDIEGLGVSARIVMQTLGTDWGRSCITPEVWIKVMRATISKCGDYAASENMPAVPEGSNMTVIIPDVRFVNEANLCDNLYLIERPDVTEVARHASEHGLPSDYFDRVVENTSSLEELKLSAEVLAADIKEERDNVLQRTGS